MDRQLRGSGLKGVASNRLKNMWVAIVALAMLLCASGCDTKNVGLGEFPIRGPIVTVTMPAYMFAYETASWSVSWTGGTAPFSVSWDFGGAAENVIQANAVSPSVVETTLMDGHAGITFTLVVTVRDANGFSGSDSSTFNVGHGHGYLYIDKVEVDGPWLYVTVGHTDGDEITVCVSGLDNISVDNYCQDVRGGNGTASFFFTPVDVLLGAYSEIQITADDGTGATRTESAWIVFPPMVLEPDTLYAIPMGQVVAVGEPITIQVVTGATGSFQFMLGVGVVLDDDASYVGGSFNVGDVGGWKDDADGVWADITFDGGFALGPDVLIIPGNNPEDSLGTNYRLDFNISPLIIGTDPVDMDMPSVSGALFNFQVSYSSAGEKTVSFQESNGVNRTYYSDSNSTEVRFWSAYEGATITVN